MDALPSVVNNETPAVRRKELYRKGGCVIITSRILVVDLLTKRVDPLLITGMLVCNAHTLSETSTEAFILRIFRRATAAGFIKAFSDDPLSLVAGFGKLEKAMRALYIRKLFLWPRFHEVVRQQLSAGKPEVCWAN
jgi:DNA excision repair protein ERCC-4